ncbi:MAG: CBS domain-containing protein [Thiobacillaceae bacterium]|jgi:CBS domain-containing protein|nr:CBS domain-containing protein [Thiobacillaceae bacterium]
MFVRDVMSVKGTGEVYGIEPDQPVSAAVRQLVEHDIGSLVVTRDGRMVGFLTERDILRGMHARGCALEDIRVSDLMEKEPLVCGPEDSVDYARDVLTKHRVSHLVVMENNQLLGVISFHDVAKACLRQANFENSLLKRYIKNWPE